MAKVNDTTFSTGRKSAWFTGDINTWNTSNTLLFTIPANSVLIGGRVIGHAAASNATTATINVGVSGLLGSEYLNQYDVHAAQGSNYNSDVAFTNFGAQNSNWAGVSAGGPLTIGSNNIGVTGKFTSTGATINGGPWTIAFEALVD